MKKWSFIALPLTLMGCEPMPEEQEVSNPLANEEAACTADQYQQYIGQRSPQITLPAGTVFRHYRTDPVVNEDGSINVVTLDYYPSRLNFEYDRHGTLVDVNCG
ncbi:I78 family peptidase inhibitor [Paracoccus sediminicola]|uniref:I78 family peptidase inhibitor n=1 Tax=Paracoccus sediminicola TaxID=3017783 RepID=UPI0022F079D8|nr:I78 family peptidase inhibitor [Paracoccus sediminicola]WBU57660.1 I78 family peptidase inhibitor [Paracoccus sediminicola]